MSWQPITDERTWDAATLHLPAAHVLQRWAWGAFKSRWGWQAERWLLTDAAGPVAAVQVLKRRLRGPLSMLYAPRGPLARDEAGWDAALAFLERRARAQRVVFAMVDGDGWTGPGPTAEARAHLAQRGWSPSPQPPQFRNTALTRIDRSDDALLAAFKPKWRYNLRLAERRGVRVRLATPDDWPALLALYAETGQRDGFIIRPAEYYTDAWRSLHGQGLIAEHEGHALAGLMLFRHGARAWYFYGMSGAAGREHMPNHLLQWEAMRWARDAGCVWYDWWGAPEREADETDRMAGVWRFKQGFDATFAEGVGAWEYFPLGVGRAGMALLRRLRPGGRAVAAG